MDELEEFIEVTKELSELYSRVIPLYNRQQVLLLKLKRGWKDEIHNRRKHNDKGDIAEPKKQ